MKGIYFILLLPNHFRKSVRRNRTKRRNVSADSAVPACSPPNITCQHHRLVKDKDASHRKSKHLLHRYLPEFVFLFHSVPLLLLQLPPDCQSGLNNEEQQVRALPDADAALLTSSAFVSRQAGKISRYLPTLKTSKYENMMLLTLFVDANVDQQWF